MVLGASGRWTSVRPGRCMHEVHGQLALGILPDVLRHVAFLRESGRVDVQSEPLHGWIELRDGRPVHAVCRRLDGGEILGMEALAAMLAWRHGSYAFEAHPATRCDPPSSDQFADLPLPSGANGANGSNGGNGLDGSLAHLFEEPGASSPNGGYGRTLAGSLEGVLEAAQALGSRRNGAHPEVVSDVEGPVVQPSGLEGADFSRQTPADAALDRPASAWPAAARPAVAPRNRGEHGVAASPGEDGRSDASAGPLGAAAPSGVPPAAPRIRGASMLLRAPGVPVETAVHVTHGALELWRHLDGESTLAELATSLGQDVDAIRSRADELLMVGIARVAPQPIYGQTFVADLVGALNEIMGPMGEILVEDALFEHGLDPRAIPRDRIDDLTTALARQLRRSDWQLKLRARVARLLAETQGETWAETRPERRTERPSATGAAPAEEARDDGHADATAGADAPLGMRADGHEHVRAEASDSRTEDSR